MAKWHEDNREKADRHCLLAAVSEGMADGELSDRAPYARYLQEAIDAGLVRKVFYHELTEAGQLHYDAVTKEIHEACEAERAAAPAEVPKDENAI